MRRGRIISFENQGSKWMPLGTIFNYLSLIIFYSKQQIYFKQKTSSMKIINFLVVLILSQCLVGIISQEIVDFTFSQLDIQREGSIASRDTIQIHPKADVFQGYTFPEACYLGKKLSQLASQISPETSHYESDLMVTSLKTDFIQLLKISQKIKRKRQNLDRLAQISGKVQNSTLVSEINLEGLKQMQYKLSQIKKEIKNYTEELDSIVKDSLRNSGDKSLAISSINFEIQSLVLKLDYLRSLKNNQNEVQQSAAKNLYDKYFDELKDRLNQENTLINELNQYLKNSDEIEKLKSRIKENQAKLEFSKLVIDDKRGCAKERAQIKQRQKNDPELKNQMITFRNYKREKGSSDNKHCEGLAAKLRERIKIILQGYDYNFRCAEGLQSEQAKKNLIENNLRVDKQKLLSLETGPGLDEYKRRLEANRKFIKDKQTQLQKFQIPTYKHNVKQIEKLIKKTEKQLEEAKDKKSSLAEPVQTKPIDYKAVQRLVINIKRLKGRYCQDYDKYEQKAQQIRRKIQTFEAEVEYSRKMKSMYDDELSELKNLESTFKRLRKDILSKLQ